MPADPRITQVQIDAFRLRRVTLEEGRSVAGEVLAARVDGEEANLFPADLLVASFIFETWGPGIYRADQYRAAPQGGPAKVPAGRSHTFQIDESGALERVAPPSRATASTASAPTDSVGAFVQIPSRTRTESVPMPSAPVEATTLDPSFAAVLRTLDGETAWRLRDQAEAAALRHVNELHGSVLRLARQNLDYCAETVLGVEARRAAETRAAVELEHRERQLSERTALARRQEREVSRELEDLRAQVEDLEADRDDAPPEAVGTSLLAPALELLAGKMIDNPALQSVAAKLLETAIDKYGPKILELVMAKFAQPAVTPPAGGTHGG